MPNILDLTLLALLVFFLVRGFMKGFMREAMGLVGLVAAVMLGAAFYNPLGDYLAHATGMQPPWVYALAFVLIMAVVFAVALYLGYIISRIMVAANLSIINRVLGGGVGLLKGVVMAYILLNLLLLLMPLNPPQQLRESVVAPHVVSAGRYVMDLIPDDVLVKLQRRSGLLGENMGQGGQGRQGGGNGQ